jgi:hypothetical protein
VKQYQSALVTLLLTATAAMPCAAQQARSTPQVLPNEICAACLAYLVFPPSLEPGSYATRGEATETPTSLPAEEGPRGRPRRQPEGLAAATKPEPRIADFRHDPEQGLLSP